jgi:5-methyltetrahydropteroyltriglutamate--homocysteine methyltransferase
LALETPGAKLLLSSYFGSLGDNLDLALSLPMSGLHIDLVRAPEQLAGILAGARHDLTLSLGVIDGRNVWRSDLSRILDVLEPVVAARSGDRIILAPSCSLLHVPLDLDLEDDLDRDMREWLAFAAQKMSELELLSRALNEGRVFVAAELRASADAASSRRSSLRIHDPAVKARVANISPGMSRRAVPYVEREQLQRSILNLPGFPTTTIGSFPQTDAVRKIRAGFAKGTLSQTHYEDALRRETEAAVRWQEEIDIDVLVHGEFERNDMVQYFGEQLSGYLFTNRDWVHC